MRRRKRRKQRKIIIISSLTLLFIMTVGYAAFQTNINITAKGNILEKPIVINELKKKVVTSGEGLYTDTYESGRYVYKGGNPDNYITFNNKLFRIISIETDGTIKIMQHGFDETMAFDNKQRTSETGFCGQGNAPTAGCNAWAATSSHTTGLGNYTGVVYADSPIKTYLNGEYYNTKITSNKNAIQTHKFYYGAIRWRNNDLSFQISQEKTESAESNVGLIQPSDFLRANSNIEQCITFDSSYSNLLTCRETNYMLIMLPSGCQSYWTLSGDGSSTGYAMHVYGSGCSKENGGRLNNNESYRAYGLIPVLYLKSDIKLSGKGTKENPYKIIYN